MVTNVSRRPCVRNADNRLSPQHTEHDTMTSLPPLGAAADAVDAASWHGYTLAGRGLPPPKCITQSDKMARPNYTTVKSAEYQDSQEVLEAKADRLIEMWTTAHHPLIYAGAGISTSSGIRDYASNGKGSKVQAKKAPLTMNVVNALQPTPAHRVITAMEKKGYVWGWLQQNHDGLAQKAGFPAHKVNELHGSWLDGAGNPIIKMSGSLRADLCDWMQEMEEGADFVFTVGTSLSGLTADQVVHTAARRHMTEGKGQGVAIISVQRTPHDDTAALRIFSRIDEFMLIVANKMKLALDRKTHLYKPAPKPVGVPREEKWCAERKQRREKGWK